MKSRMISPIKSQTNSVPRIMLTAGEPAGIGPDIILQLAQHAWPAELVAVADPTLLQTRATQLQLNIELQPFSSDATPQSQAPATLTILPVPLAAPCKTGQLNMANAHYVMTCLELATEQCLTQGAHALVTGPAHKSIINEAGIPFLGHTEFLAQYCGTPKTIMLFVLDQLKVALATTHLPLAKVPSAISQEGLLTTLRLLQAELNRSFQLPRPKILVAGLNPHAGENGLLGTEEQTILLPVIQQLQSEEMDVLGPFPADTLFIEAALHQADAILSLYHDQALPVVKTIGFERAVNMTLGLPIIRTSVDHGTALHLAGTGQTNPQNMQAALELAIALSQRGQME